MDEKRFNDGIIDLSSLREKREAKKAAEYNPDAISQSIPSGFLATDDNDEEVNITVISAAIMPDKIYLILTDNVEGEPPFLMIAGHKENVFTGDLAPATEQDLVEYNEIVEAHKEAQAEGQVQEVEDTRQQQLQEMLEKAESEEEKELIQEAFNRL